MNVEYFQRYFKHLKKTKFIDREVYVSKLTVELILGQVLDQNAHEQWWKTSIPKLGSKTPEEQWEEDPEKVFDLLEDYVNPSFS